MKKSKILSWVLALAMLASLVVVPAAAADAVSFPDMEGHWSTESVDRWSAAKVFNGDENGNFNPDRQMTRAEFATVLANMMGYTVKAENVFTDVAADAWYADAVLKLAAAGVLQGSEGYAMPEAPISREQAAVMLCRAFSLQPSAEGKIDFADSESVSDWAKDAVTALSERKMISGVEDGSSFAPALNINRASVAKLLDNMISTYVNAAGATVSGEQTGIVVVAAEGVTFQDAKLAENVIVAPAAAGTVTLAGSTEAANVIVAAEGAKVVVNKTASAENIAVEAPKAAVTVAGKVENVTVAEAAEGAALTVQNGATVSNVETAADNVTVDGAGKIENLTVSAGEGVEVSKDTTVTKLDNKTESDVTVGGSTVGGGSTGSNEGTGGSGTLPYPTNSYAVKVNYKVVGQGTVTLTNAKQKKADTYENVTIEATPAAGWKFVKVELTAKPEDSSATVTSNASTTLTPDVEGTYEVTVTFGQPLKVFEATVATTQAQVLTFFKTQFKDLVDAGTLTEAMINEAYGDPAGEPWLLIACRPGMDGVTVTNTVFTNAFKINGEAASATWNGAGASGEFTACSLHIAAAAIADTDTLVTDKKTGEVTVTVTVGDVEYTANAGSFVASDYDAEKAFDITLKLNNGEADKVIHSYENQAETLPTVGREHYEFASWHTAEPATDENKVDLTSSGGKFSATEATTLFAKWTPVEYTVTYDANGGTGDAPEENTKLTAETTDAFTAKAGTGLTKEGCTFAGWAFANDATEADFAAEAAMPAATLLAKLSGNSVTLYAVWAPEVYDVKIMDGETELKTVQVEYNETIPAEELKLTKEGYKFVGLFTEKELTNEFTATTAITEAKTLYVKWVEVFTVTFKDAEGEGKDTVVEVEKDGTVDSDAIPTPEKDGFAFKGWLNGESEFESTTTITENLTLTAKWVEVYTVTFKDAEGEGKDKVVEVEKVEDGDTKITESDIPTPTKDGNTFGGWFNGEAEFTKDTVLTGNITLTAKWTPDTTTTG